MASKTTGTVFNPTDGPVLLDEAGHVLGGGEYADGVALKDEPVAGHIAADRLVIVETPKEA